MPRVQRDGSLLPYFRFSRPVAVTILDIIHRPVFYLKQRFGDRILLPASGDEDKLYLLGPTEQIVTEDRQNQASELCFKCKTGRWIMSGVIIVLLMTCSQIV
jgi:hypothetical protein